MADYGGIGMALQAFGRGLRGGDGMAVVKDYQEGLERIKRKEAVQNMLGKMGISGQEKALLDTMDPEAVQAFLANRMQQDYARRNAPGRAPTQAEIELQQIRELSKHFGGTSEAPAPSSGYSMGEPLDQTIGPRADLSFNVQGELPGAIKPANIQAMPVGSEPMPAAQELSFGETIRNPVAKNPLEAQIAETQRKYDQAFMLAEQGIPKADHFLKLYGDRLEALKAQAEPKERERVQDANGRWRYVDDGSLVFPNVEAQERPADEYGRYVQEELAAGREPLSRIDYKQAIKGDGVSLTTPDGFEFRMGGSGGQDLTSSTRTEIERTATAFQSIQNGLNTYRDIVKEGGGTVLPGQQRDKLLSARRDMQLQMKELYNLGVLNGPDLTLMNEMLVDATDPLNVGLDVLGVESLDDRVDTSVNQLVDQMRRLAGPKLALRGLQIDDEGNIVPAKAGGVTAYSKMSIDELLQQDTDNMSLEELDAYEARFEELQK